MLKRKGADKKMRVLVISIFFIALFTNSVYAVPFEKIYMTDGFGSFEIKSFYEWDETPYLYLRLPVDGQNYAGPWWGDPHSNFYFTGDTGSERDIWFSLDNGVDMFNNPVTWIDVREKGKWNMNAFYMVAGGPIGAGTTDFTVPEPMTLILFIAGGGGILAGKFLRRKKR
jgi:hypothetical protein